MREGAAYDLVEALVLVDEPLLEGQLDGALAQPLLPFLPSRYACRN